MARWADGTTPPRSLADTIARCWQGVDAHRFTVLTGGEPLLQVDAALLDALHAPRLRDRHRDQRHGRAAGGDRLALRQPQDGRSAQGRQGARAQARLPAGRPAAGAFHRPRLPALLAAADGRPRRGREHQGARSTIASPIRSGSSARRPTSISVSADVGAHQDLPLRRLAHPSSAASTPPPAGASTAIPTAPR